jgi:hypothetical protein
MQAAAERAAKATPAKGIKLERLIAILTFEPLYLRGGV